MGCDHVWETVEKCFICEEIRPKTNITDIFHESDRSCPKDTAWEIIKELAMCDYSGQSETLKRLIITSHSMLISGEKEQQ